MMEPDANSRTRCSRPPLRKAEMQQNRIPQPESHSYRKLYAAVCSCDPKEVEDILKKWEINEEDLEDIISKVCYEIKLNITPISEEMELLLEKKLIEIRFFSSNSRNNVKWSDITERIQLVEEIIDELPSYRDNDEKFIFSLTFIIKQIHVLKQLLKSTYDRLPWEEMEFCLLSFVRTFKEQNILNVFYRATLNKHNISQYLKRFSCKLIQIRDFLIGVDVKKLSKMPNLKRVDAINMVTSSSPEFSDLYRDHEAIRDIHSINLISEYVKVASSIDFKEEHAQLVIMRALQMIGEHLKNTLESPNLSETTSNYLLTVLNENTREVIINLRNSLSHAFSLSKRLELQNNMDENFFVGIQNDIKKIGKVLDNIFLRNNLQLLRSVAKRLIDSEDLEAMKEIASLFENINIFEIFGQLHIKNETNELDELKKLIEQLSLKIPEKSFMVDMIFRRINNFLHADRNQSKQKLNYQEVFLSFCCSLHQINIYVEDSVSNKTNFIRTSKYFIGRLLDRITPELEMKKGDEIAELLDFILIDPTLANLYNYEEIIELTFQIIHLVKFEVGSVSWSEKFKRKLTLKDSKFSLRESESIQPKYSYPEQLTLKLSQLEYVLRENSDKQLMTYEIFKKDRKIQALVEALVLDITSIFYDLGKFNTEESLFFLDSTSPSLLGKNLRNHLAHNNVIDEVLFNPILTIFLNAEKLIRGGAKCLKQDNGKNGKYNFLQLKSQFTNGIVLIEQKQKMFSDGEKGNFEQFKKWIVDGEDFRARDLNKSTCLHFAAGNSVKLIKYLCQQGLNPAAKDVKARTPLHISAARGNVEISKYLIEKSNSSVNAVDYTRRTPLHYAAHHGHKLVVQTLMNHKADVFKEDLECFTALQYAILSENKEVLELFLTDEIFKKANVITGGLTSLHIAAEKGLLEMVQILLIRKVEVDAKSGTGGTAIHVAALYGHLEVVQTLILHGADVNIRAVNGCTPLHNATENGFEHMVELLLQHGADVDMADHEGKFTPLHYASKDGNVRIVEILIRYGANVNNSTASGLTALHLAAEHRRLDVVKILLTLNEIEINKKNFMNYTPLHILAENGDVKIARLLIQKGAKLDNESDLMSPLHLATKNGHELMVNLLVENGALVKSTNLNKFLLHAAVESGNINIVAFFVKKAGDINCRDYFQSTCLHIAARNGKKDIVELLIQNGAEINLKNAKGLTTLHEAVTENHSDVVKCLVEHGANINSVDYIGNTLIHTATSFGFTNVVELLIDYGAELYTENKMGHTPLQTAIKNNKKDIVNLLVTQKTEDAPLKCMMEAIYEGKKAIIEILLAHYPDSISQILHEGMTLLHLAVLQVHVDIVRILLEKGANVNVTNDHNFSPLHSSVSEGNDEISEMLLAAGADVNASDIEGLTPLHIASKNGSPNIVQILLNQNAAVDILDKKKRLPLDFAVANGHLKICELLMEAEKVDLNRKGNNEFTMLHIAAQLGHSEIIEYLIQKGADIDSKNDMNSKPIHIAAREGFQDIVEIFLKKGMSIDDRGAADNSLLHYAASFGKIEVLKYLLNRGYDINSVNIWGKTALHLACELPDHDTVKFLLNAEAIFNIPDLLGKKPQCYTNNGPIIGTLSLVEKLFTSIKLNKVHDVEVSLNEGVILNAKDVNKGLPLHFAVYKGIEDIVRMLLKNKARPNSTCKNGCTALHYAAKYSHTKIVISLLSHGAQYNAVSGTGKTPIDFSSEKSINNLLKLISDSFDSIRKRNIDIVSRLEKLKDEEIIKAIMNARNKDGKTLITFAIQNNFPKVDRLKCITQTHLLGQLELAEILLVQERYQEALQLYEKIYQKRRDFLGSDNPGTLDMRTKIANILYKQQHYHRALTIFEEIYSTQLEVLGENSKFTLATKGSIGLVLHRLGKNEKSLNILQETHKTQKKLLGGMHRDVLDTQVNLGLVLNTLRKFEEALDMNYQTLKAFEMTLGPLDPGSLSIKNNVALVLTNLREYEKASKVYDEVYDARKKVLGPFHSDTLRCKHNKIALLVAEGKHDEVLEAYEEIYRIQKQHLGPKHLDTLNTRHNMGLWFKSRGRFYTAFKIFKEVQDSRKNILGEKHSDIIYTENMIDAIKQISQFHGNINGDLDSFVENLQNSMYNAAKNGDLETVSNLLKSGVEADSTDVDGRTPLHFAVDGGNIDIINLLIKNGGNVIAATSKGNTALHTACSKNSKEIVEVLLKHSSNAENLDHFIDAQTVIGRATALHVAAKNGCPEIVEMLLTHGAVYNLENKDHLTPMDVTENQKVFEILKLIKEMFQCVHLCNFEGLREKLFALEENKFKCVVNAHNTIGLTLPRLVLMSRRAELARALFERMKSIN